MKRIFMDNEIEGVSTQEEIILILIQVLLFVFSLKFNLFIFQQFSCSFR
jgi:hypothetical protein